MVATAAACLLDIKDEGQNPPIRAGGRSENTQSFNATGFDKSGVLIRSFHESCFHKSCIFYLCFFS
jgi:hypothetical protein